MARKTNNTESSVEQQFEAAERPAITLSEMNKQIANTRDAHGKLIAALDMVGGIKASVSQQARRELEAAILRAARTYYEEYQLEQSMRYDYDPFADE